MDPRSKAEAAGITGTAGAGLPFHDRLTRRVDVVVANGVACEPLLDADRAVLQRFPDAVLNALSTVAACTDASRLMVAVRGTDAPLLSALEQVRRKHPAVQIMRVEDTYPLGESGQLTLALLGRQVPSSGHPEDVGVMVVNAHTLWQFGEALRDRPMTHRFVTVSGEVQQPQTLRVPLGVTVQELVEICGGHTLPGGVADRAYVVGGPARARIVAAETPVVATTQSVMVLPSSHPVVTRATLPIEHMLTRAASMCAGCRQCTDRCPAHLGGYAIVPHLLMRGLTHRLETVSEVVTGASSCIGCRLCDVVCPGNLSPGRIYGMVAADLRARGMGALPTQPPTDPLVQGEARKVPRAHLIERLGVRAYARELPSHDGELLVKRVLLPLPGLDPVVREGERVERGMPVALPTVPGQGVRLHAPIAGRVMSIRNAQLELVVDS